MQSGLASSSGRAVARRRAHCLPHPQVTAIEAPQFLASKHIKETLTMKMVGDFDSPGFSVQLKSLSEAMTRVEISYFYSTFRGGGWGGLFNVPPPSLTAHHIPNLASHSSRGPALAQVITPGKARLCHAMPYHTIPCHTIPCHAPCRAPCHAPCRVMPCRAMPCLVILSRMPHIHIPSLPFCMHPIPSQTFPDTNWKVDTQTQAVLAGWSQDMQRRGYKEGQVCIPPEALNPTKCYQVLLTRPRASWRPLASSLPHSNLKLPNSNLNIPSPALT